MTHQNLATTGRIAVWDRFVRVFHLALILGVACAYVTSQAGMQQTHVRVGYFLIGLITARLIWGVIGSRHARFSDFLYPPRIILRHVQAILSGHPPRHLGHDPAGGAMIALMLAMLTVILSAGLLLQGTLEFSGPLQAVQMEDRWVYLLRGLHVTLVNIFSGLVVMHITGVLVVSVLSRENLTWAIFSGYKKRRTQ
ncbi:MAG: cytochrome b/b6 domain-containing protein [Pseudomonadota bacterium]